MLNDLIDAWTYESVEYSDGYYHTVFDSHGTAVCDCYTEILAKEMVEKHNQGQTI